MTASCRELIKSIVIVITILFFVAKKEIHINQYCGQEAKLPQDLQIEDDRNMTMQEAKQTMRYMESVFDVVRLLEADTLREIHYGDYTSKEPKAPCQCYDFWEKSSPCENCVSIRALEEKSRKVKMEFIDSVLYKVIAKYMEIDGREYVMEMINCLDDELILDPQGKNRLLKKISGYQEALYTDALTGASNRHFYENMIKNMKTPAGVAMIDLDDFKLYNDTLGHKVGDLVLRTVAEVTRSCIRKTDILIRYGGDEFILILPDVEPEIFTQKLKSIRRKVQEAKVPGYPGLKMSVSIGGVMSEGDTVEEAISRADHFMYMAKNKKNMVVTEENSTGGKLEGRKEKFFEDLQPKILIIDDSEMNRAILREVLGEEFAVLEAANGEEGLEYLEEHEEDISLVLLDIIMPVMDGFEVLRVMSEKNFLDNIPVIMISSEESETYVKKAYEMGAMDYINRPFDAQVVYRRVFNTIKLYAKQRRLIALVTDQIKSELKK